MPRTIPRPQGGTGSGNVVGPATSTSDAIVRFGSATGDLLANSIPTIDDNGNLTLNAGPIPNAAELRLMDENVLDPKYVALRAPSTISNPTSFAIKLPETPPSGANQAMTSDGAGNLIWQEPIFSGGGAGGSLTGTYPSPTIGVGVISSLELAAGAVDIDQLALNIVDNYLPSTAQREALAGTSGTPSATNPFLTQEGGTLTPVSPGTAFGVVDPVTSDTTYDQAADGTATFTPTATSPAAIQIAPASPTTSAFTVTDPTTSVTTVDQKADGTVGYTDPADTNNTTEVSGTGVVINNIAKSISISGDQIEYVYNEPPDVSNFFQYNLYQPINVSVSLQTSGGATFSESESGNTGELRFSAAGSSTAGVGTLITSTYNGSPAELNLDASSVRITGDFAPNSLPGSVGEVLVSQGPGVPPVWSASGSYNPTTSSDWTIPTPPEPAGSATAPTNTGGALDILAAQNYARWLNTRTTRTDAVSANVVGTDESVSVILADASAGNIVETLPAASALTGKFYTVKKIDSTANTVTVARAGSDTIDGQTSVVLETQDSTITLISDGADWYNISFLPSAGSSGQLLTSAGAGASLTWTSPSAFTSYTPSTSSDWTTPTPPSPTGSGVVPSTIAGALNTLAAQNYSRWLNLRTTESRSTSGNALVSDDSVSVILADATSGAVAVTLPDPLAWAGKWLTVKKTDASANAVTVTGGVGVLIDGAGTQSIAYQYDAITVVSDGTNWSILDKIDSTPPAPTISATVSVSLNGSATNGAPTFIGGFYVPAAATYTVNSRMYLGITAAGTIQVDVKDLVNVTIATFTYVAATSGFFDVTLAAPVSFSAGWYNLTLTAVSAGTTVFARGMHLTTV